MTKYNSVQALRAVAALLVVVYHGAWWLMHGGIDTPMAMNVAAIGVDIFFVLSGFVMMLLADRPGHGVTLAVSFWLRRLARIAPAYWAGTCLLLLAIGSQVSWQHTATSFLFVPHLPGGEFREPVLGAGWTLIYEMGFYLLVGLSLLLPVRPVHRLVAIMAALATVWIADRAAGGAVPALHYYASPVVFEFGVGGALYFVLGQVRTAWVIRVAVTLALTTALALAWTNLDDWGNDLMHGRIGWLVFAALVCIGFVLSETLVDWRRFGGLLAVGDASYALYLANWYLFTAIDVAVPWERLAHLPSWQVAVGYHATALSVCAATAVVIYKRLERPAYRRLNALLDRWLAGGEERSSRLARPPATAVAEININE